MVKKAKKSDRTVTKKKVKKAVKKIMSKKSVMKKVSPVMPKPKLVGEITHFYPDIYVAVVEIKNELKQGDKITISGHGQSFEQKVASMQVNHQPIKIAKKKQIIGMKVARPVKEKDLIYR